MGKSKYSIPIYAPMSGSVVDLGQVPDPIYSQRMMGDGVAIIPEEGTMFSPVNGYVSVVAGDKHAFGFTTDTGLEILVHLGVDSKVQEDCVAVHVKVNDRVQAGDMVAEFDLEKLKSRGVNTITPIIICGGLDDKKVEPATGHILAGSGAVMTVIDVAAMARDEAAKKAQEGDAEEKEPEEKEAKENHSAQKQEAADKKEDKAEKEALDFLRNKRNWVKLIGGFVALTALMVVIFVSIAMYIGH